MLRTNPCAAMLRANSLSGRLVQKRTLRPLYTHKTVMPIAQFLDHASLDGREVYPGMVASGIGTSLVTADNCNPVGLFSNFVNGPLDELGGRPEIGVWTKGLFEVLFPVPNSDVSPIDDSQEWLYAEKGDPVHAGFDGFLSSWMGPQVARVVENHYPKCLVVELDFSQAVADHYLLGYRGVVRPDLQDDKDYMLGILDGEGDRRYET